MAVGDGANDIPMLNTAGLGVAVDAKPLVKGKAPYFADLDDFAYLSALL